MCCVGLCCVVLVGMCWFCCDLLGWVGFGWVVCCVVLGWVLLGCVLLGWVSWVVLVVLCCVVLCRKGISRRRKLEACSMLSESIQVSSLDGSIRISRIYLKKVRYLVALKCLSNEVLVE